MRKIEVTIGLISYQDEQYLEHCLPSLFSQTDPNFEILIWDNNPDPATKKWIQNKFPTIKIYGIGQNIGFSKAHNFLIDQAKGQYYLALNSDLFLEPDFMGNLVNSISQNDRIACVTGKLWQWNNFPKSPAQIQNHYLDTTGLVIKKNHQVFDRGQGEKDQGQYDQKSEIWGASAAAALYRITALQDIAPQRGEYFDQHFFMYKEDIDLSYRLRWAGWKTIYNPLATAYHDRTATLGNIISTWRARKTRAKQTRQHSFVNQFLLLAKNTSPNYSFLVKLKTWLFKLKYLVYISLFETRLLKEIKMYWKLKKEILKKAKTMPRRIKPEEMEKWFK
jgi:GT2 family glycosyltransferase